MCRNFFYENCAVYEIILKNMVKLDRPHVTMAACCILDKEGYTRECRRRRRCTHNHT
jgi:hypothetical protein